MAKQFGLEMRGKEIYPVCRLCLGEAVKLIDIFQPSKGSIPGWTPATAIMELLRIQVSEGDKYPQCVCIVCMSKLEDFKFFKQLCENNKDLLDRAYAASLGSEENKGVQSVVCCDENLTELPLDEECPIRDPLDVYGIKTEDGEGGSTSNELSSAESIGSLDNISVRIKTDCTDDLKTEEPDRIITALCSSAETLKSNEETHDVVGVFCSSENDGELSLKEEEDVGITIDPLHLEEDPIKSENASNDCPSEAIGSAISEVPSMKSEQEDLVRTVEINQNTLHSSAVEVKSNKGIISECVNFYKDSDDSHKEEVLDIPAESDSDGTLEDGVQQITGDESTAEDNCSDIPHKSEENSTSDHNMSEPLPSGTHSMGPIGTSTLSNMECINGNKEQVNETNAVSSRTDTDAYRCTDCGEKFALIEDLESHKRRHIGKERHRGDVGVDSSDKLTGKFYVCDFCDKKFSVYFDLKRHKLVHAGKKLYSCDLCDKRFVYKKGAKEHMLSHDGSIQHDCHVCKKTYSSKRCLRVHLLIHTDVKNFGCHVCSMKFRNNGALKRHLTTHSIDRPHKCPECDKTFSSRDGVNQHMRIHSSNGRFVCDVCDKRYHRNADLKKHSFTHSSERPYRCTECGKGFLQKNALTEHSRIHSGSKPYECGVCSKAFTQKCQLTVHMACHSSERPFKCGLCAKSFSLNGSLKTHMLTHSGQKKYKCDLCDRSFHRRESMIGHFRIHTGEKPFECNECGKTFIYRTNLKVHLKDHSLKRIRVFCNECRAGFCRKFHLRKHIVEMHS